MEQPYLAYPVIISPVLMNAQRVGECSLKCSIYVAIEKRSTRRQLRDTHICVAVPSCVIEKTISYDTFTSAENPDNGIINVPVAWSFQPGKNACNM